MNGQCVVSCFLGRGILHGHLFTNGIFLAEAAALIWLSKRAASKVPRQHHFIKLLLGAGERDQLTLSFLGFASAIRYE